VFHNILVAVDDSADVPVMIIHADRSPHARSPETRAAA
jgi:hypothetical protein